ncbi:MAG: 50S ribosomal protein L9 [Pseudomonadota bacterium]
MEVILLERVGRIGTVGDVVKVKDGYARNFLLPQKKALRATEANKSVFELRRAEIEATNAKLRAEAQKESEKIKNFSVKIVRQASEDGKLYGSVSVRDVADSVNATGHEFLRTQFVLNATIKNIGSYDAKIILHPEVIVNIKVNVVRNESDVIKEESSESEQNAA